MVVVVLVADAETFHVLFHGTAEVGDGTARAFQLVGQLLQLGAAGHQAGELVPGDLVLLVVADGRAAVQQQEPVAHRVGVVRVVGDEDDAQAAFAGLDDVLQHHPGLLDAEGGGRLVQDQHLGAEVHGAGDRHALALPAGQGADGLVHVAQVDAHRQQLVLAHLLHGPDLNPGTLAELVAQEEVTPDRHQRHHGQVLVDGGDAALERLAGRGEVDRGALHLVGARGRLVQPGDDLDQGGLAGPVVTQHAGDLAGAHLHVDVVQRDHRAVAFPGVDQADQRHAAPAVAGLGGVVLARRGVLGGTHIDASARRRM